MLLSIRQCLVCDMFLCDDAICYIVNFDPVNTILF